MTGNISLSIWKIIYKIMTFNICEATKRRVLMLWPHPDAQRPQAMWGDRQASHLTVLYLMVAKLRRKWILVSKASSKWSWRGEDRRTPQAVQHWWLLQLAWNPSLCNARPGLATIAQRVSSSDICLLQTLDNLGDGQGVEGVKESESWDRGRHWRLNK